MDDYCKGIIYATGHMVIENDKPYLVVRNSDPWYVQHVSKYSGNKMFKSGYKEKHGGVEQWIIKARDITSIPCRSEINSVSDFCRAYIEIHGFLDFSKRKNNKRKLRLRIYGKENIIHFINVSLPAKEKKIQYICNSLDNRYTGKTCAIYYQDEKEIKNILYFIDGEPRNAKIWDKWKNTIESIEL